MLYVFKTDDVYDFVPIGEIKSYEMKQEHEISNELDINGNYVFDTNSVKTQQKISLEITNINMVFLKNIINERRNHQLFKIKLKDNIIKFKAYIRDINYVITDRDEIFGHLDLVIHGSIKYKGTEIQDINKMSIYEIMNHVNDRIIKQKQLK